MKNLNALLITFVAGFLFLLGIIITKKCKNKDFLYKFSASLALSVITFLLIFDIIPEILEAFSTFNITKKLVYFLSFILIGIIILKILDCFVPAHHHDHKDNEKNRHEHDNHIYHIGFITSLAIILHNIIEGIAIYTVGVSNLETGLIMCIGVGLHNIPMGMEISSSIDLSNKNKIYQYLIYFLVIISTALGGLIGLTFKTIDPIVIGILLSITCGMLIYIAFFELLVEIKKHLKEKATLIGLITGIIAMLLTLFI